MAVRMLAIAGLIFADQPPAGQRLARSGGWGRADTTIILLDRSPSMHRPAPGGRSKLETGRGNSSDALQTLGSTAGS